MEDTPLGSNKLQDRCVGTKNFDMGCHMACVASASVSNILQELKTSNLSSHFASEAVLTGPTE